MSGHLRSGSALVDMMSGVEVGQIDDLHSRYVTLGPHEGRSFLVEPPDDTGELAV
jgi:hypothetical protein